MEIFIMEVTVLDRFEVDSGYEGKFILFIRTDGGYYLITDSIDRIISVGGKTMGDFRDMLQPGVTFDFDAYPMLNYWVIDEAEYKLQKRRKK
jgi:hypothetical protein